MEKEKSLAIRCENLLERIRVAETRMDVRERLSIIAEGFSYLSEVCAEETKLQSRALLVIIRDRAEKKKRKHVGVDRV